MKTIEALDIKLIALDMDGTVLNEEQEISLENRKAIKEAIDQGVHVVISTGRSLKTLQKYLDTLELSSYLVTVNGSEIWDDTGVLMERSIVQNDLIQWMWELSKLHETNFWAISTEQVWHNELPTDLSTSEWLKFGFHIDDDQVRETVKKQLVENGLLEISNSSPFNLEVNPLGINKAKGLEAVCKKLNLTMENVMAVGDSLNDIAMIREAGLGVAMGNAQDIVKETADDITASNVEDGVAKAIRKWVLKY
ncbi:Cof-type HAD-IIB family hydrolase [Bacillus sp. 03113]|uniref:Cof-type HAD-IIB family hydrolase n=1 Tax=Bacillus sp. 03113 TaxID=2578211 RepID=UPI0011433554|nr:Cof-type HAD-IIB family hydrolase [Bacillus sp. 03113]